MKNRKKQILAMLFAMLLCVMVLPFTAYAGSDAGEPPEEPPAESSTPESITEQAPLTPPGTGTVIDHYIDPNGKEFYTIVTQDGTYFYLIIDHQRETDNVYFLIVVSKEDLVPLAEYSQSESAIPVPEPSPAPTPEPIPAPAPEKSGGMSMVPIIVLVLLAAGGAAYYLKIYKPKHEQADDMEDDFDYEAGEIDPYTEDAEDDNPPWYEDEDETDAGKYSEDDET